jgi:hypothetical protein
MLAKAAHLVIVGTLVAVLAVAALRNHLPIGPVVLLLTLVPLLGLAAPRRSWRGALPDLVFGAIDTGLLTIPALWGGTAFGVAGAITGGVIGDALTDAVAGFFEGGVAQWLRAKGIEAAREPVTTALGKMAGCLLGSGVVLSAALLLGIRPTFD